MNRKQDLPRVRYLRDKHSAKLQAEVASDRVRARILRREHGAFEMALAMDPTKKAVYLSTILRWLRGTNLHLEDAKRVRRSLAEFDRTKHRLPVEKRDIGIYGHPGDLEDAIEPLVQGGEIFVPSDILAISPILASGRGWSLHEAGSVAAAQWWAKSSSWCTSVAKTAKSYLDKGPLHVLVAGGSKFQFHAPTDQLRDVRDRMVERMPDDMPLEAMQSLVDVLLRPMEGVSWIRLEPLLRLYSIMDSYDQGNRRKAFPEMAHSTQRNRSAWMSVDGRTVVMAGGSKEAIVSGIDIHSTPSKGFAWTSRHFARDQVWKEISEPDSTVFDMIRSGVARMKTAGLSSDGWLVAESGNEIHALFGKDILKVGVDGVFGEVGMHMAIDDRRIGGRCPLVLYTVNLRGEPENRVHRLADSEDLLRAPSHVRMGVSAWQSLGLAYGPFEMFGQSAVDESVGEGWRSKRLRSLVLDMGIEVEWKDGVPTHPGRYDRTMRPWPANIEEMTRIVFEDLDHRAIWGMFRSLRASWRDWYTPLERMDGPVEGAVEALLSIKDVPGSGTLLAAVPDDACTEALVDELIAAGRTETVSVMPWRLITPERLEWAVTRLEPGQKLFGDHLAARSLSSRSLGMLNTHASGSRFHYAHKELFVGKGLRWVDRVVDGTNERTSELRARLKQRSIETDGVIAEMMELPAVRERFETVFHGVPPNGRPWPLVLEALRTSLDGIEDVVADLPESNWCGGEGDVDLRMEDLMSIPGAAERIAAMQVAPG